MRLPRSFKSVRDPDEADFEAVRVTLFAKDNRLCGWFIAPLSTSGEAGYIPKSASLPATLAVVRALELADSLDIGLCVIDPEGLWPEVWPLG